MPAQLSSTSLAQRALESPGPHDCTGSRGWGQREGLATNMPPWGCCVFARYLLVEVENSEQKAGRTRPCPRPMAGTTVQVIQPRLTEHLLWAGGRHWRVASWIDLKPSSVTASPSTQNIHLR